MFVGDPQLMNVGHQAKARLFQAPEIVFDCLMYALHVHGNSICTPDFSWKPIAPSTEITVPCFKVERKTVFFQKGQNRMGY